MTPEFLRLLRELRILAIVIVATMAALIAWLQADARAAERCQLEEQGEWVGTLGLDGRCEHGSERR